ncbi:hypothetical protein [Salinisphaera sp. T31B1]|uniref:hypothetical protein n=1 Tax=Salinisphaera sp. T31B1 TaxID=727963 RepID=UPI0033414855
MVDQLLAGLVANDFYIVWPDAAGIIKDDRYHARWAMDDLIHHRPARSRRHPEYAEAFERVIQESESPGVRF